MTRSPSTPGSASSVSERSTTRTPPRPRPIAEELDDRVDTLTRGFLGLTVACARCHDHKFDPIPTTDYYSIAGIYMGTNLSDAPLATPSELKAYNEAQAKVKEIDDKMKALTRAKPESTAQKQAAGADCEVPARRRQD